MVTKNRISQTILFVLLSLSAATLNQHVFHNSEGLRADGTAPPAPPIPYDHQSGEPVLQADGTAPPAPPIPYSITLTA